jgi:tRNA threonylcarbamoyladenosine biosynthesis protein TsaB
MENKPFILCLETSAEACSVAVFKGSEMVAMSESAKERSHAEKITVLVAESLKNAKIEFSQLQAVAVSSGPGSYTGLRIGSSTAKGYCYALNIPLIAIPTLDALAYQLIDKFPNYLICPMVDARRMEVYCAIYNSQAKQISSVEAKIIDENSFSDINKPIVFCGDGAEKCKNMLNNPQFQFLDNTYPHASLMGFLAFEKYTNEVYENLAYFEPFYLKEFIALKPSKI